MRNQQGDDLPLRYWLSLVRADVRLVLRRRWSPLAGLRASWGTLSRRNNTQRCADCGRAYSHWVCSDELWERVVGGRYAVSGLCTSCLDSRAEAKGIVLLWSPVDAGPDFMAALNETCERIGAFR